MNETVFYIQDSEGVIHNKVKHPAVMFDKACGTLYKIGERENILDYYNKAVNAYTKAGYKELTLDLVFMELPHDQDIIDKVFNITGYVKTLYESITKESANHATTTNTQGIHASETEGLTH